MVIQIEHQIYAIVVLDYHFSENKYAEKLELVLSTKKNTPQIHKTQTMKKKKEKEFGE